MTEKQYPGEGTLAMAELMDAAHAVIHPESASLHGVTESEYETDHQCDSMAMAAAAADGFTPVLLLGQGSSADVWRCADEALHREREVAVKTIRPDSKRSPDAAEALLRCEAEILSTINHPGVVHLIRHAGQGDAAYLAMQYVDGDTLAVHCQVLGLELDARLRLLEQVLGIVEHLHAKGIVHGDIKPEHILICEGGHAVLIDFGLAAKRRYAESIASGDHRVGGSGPYCAPEVLDGSLHRPDPRQDVYALGVILRKLVDEAEGAEDDLLKQKLVVFLDRATNADPSKRFQDAGAMRGAFQALIGAGAEPEQGGQANHTAPRFPKAKNAVIVLLAVITFVAMGVAWTLVGDRDQAQGVGGLGQGAGPRGPMQLSQRAGLLEGVLAEIAAGQLEVAEEQFEPIVNELPPAERPWEIRHLAARLSGQGLAMPYPENPYQASFALHAAYDSAGRTLAYVRHAEQAYEVWAHTQGEEPNLLASSSDFIQAIAIAPEAKYVAGLIGDGSVTVWPALEAKENGQPQHTLPRENNAKKVWFGSDGGHLYVFAPDRRTVECWSATDDQATEPIWAIDQCDHAYELPSGQGHFMVATLHDDEPTTLRMITENGEEVRALQMPDSALPVSVDTLPGPDALVCLGMNTGYVLMHAPESGWLDPADLGNNHAVSAIVYSPAESRVFAGMGRVHILDTQGRLMMRLGHRDDPHEHITALHYDPLNASLFGVSLRRVWQWSCKAPGD